MRGTTRPSDDVTASRTTRALPNSSASEPSPLASARWAEASVGLPCSSNERMRGCCTASVSVSGWC